MRSLKDFFARVDVMRTEYNTDDLEHPREIATLYNVFKYYDGGGRTETLHHLILVRRKQKIVLRDRVDTGFYDALIKYHRIIRRRANEWHPIGLLFRAKEEAYRLSRVIEEE